MTVDQEIIKDVKRWISDFVIKLNLCPFAHPPFSNGSINFVVADYPTEFQFLSSFRSEIKILSKSEISTSLVIMRDKSIGFLEYLRIFDLCEKSLAESGLDNEFQLASFHPDYQFADSDFSDQSNFTNRSPYPIVHILRIAEVSAAINSFGDTSLIYKRNMETLESLTSKELNAYIKP